MRPEFQTKADLRAERDHWKELAERGLEPRIKHMRFEDGEFDASLTGEAVEAIAVAMVSHFKAIGAENYFEISIYDRAEPFQRYILTLQKSQGLSPADKVTAAEKRIAELEAQLPSPPPPPNQGEAG